MPKVTMPFPNKLASKAASKRPLEAHRIRLTKRDIDILTTLTESKVMTTYQLSGLYFPSLQRARKRLRLLHLAGLIARMTLPVVVQGIPNLYSLSNKGAKMLNLTSSGRPAHNRLSRSTLALSSVDHEIAISEFRTRIANVCKEGGRFRLSHWRQRSVQKLTAKVVDVAAGQLNAVTIVPDASFQLNIEDHTLEVYVEVDRGTMALGRLINKVKCYSAFCRQQGGLQPEIPALRVAFIFGSRRRKESFVKSVEKEIGAAQLRSTFAFLDEGELTRGMRQALNNLARQNSN